MSTVEALDQDRRRMLVGALIGFSMWQGSWIVSHALPRGTAALGAQFALALVSLVGWAFWGFYLFRILRWTRRVRADDSLAAALNDERVKLARIKASALAFHAVMETQAILLIASVISGSIPAAMVAQVSILVGIVAAMGGFLAYERE